MKRLLVTLIIVVIPISVGAKMTSYTDHLRATSQFRVVITGDSILRLSQSGLPGPDRFFDVEDGRQVNIKGATGNLSSQEAAKLYIPLVAPGGFFVFQDNGAQSTQSEWRILLQNIVANLPPDRCVIGVLPVSIAPMTPATISDVAAKANIMVTEFNKHPCHEYVRWNQQVIAHPEFVYDGQHPTQPGIDYLISEINYRTGS